MKFIFLLSSAGFVFTFTFKFGNKNSIECPSLQVQVVFIRVMRKVHSLKESDESLGDLLL